MSFNSDIDLALIVAEPISHEEEWEIDNAIRKWDANLACDIIFIHENLLSHISKGNNIIRPILHEGIRLSGLLY
jgi:vacuolar-type H+-ATPase subunit F/Vma7